ncbi:hypothetical protein H7992_14385 [Sporosarcina sp. resist]|uniref:hypothetical protein n=1 Tax=Sporosarcina sp. resist TaxID=2762563 RepID=UPI00164EC936|nr:hypothetical protein [Sporosarcina sp. resist]QNK86447.1 hypothetical protein H7992_14385 [Sporosarcina sp. resist]
MILMTINWTAISAISSAISAIIALIVVLINIKSIKKTNEMLHMGNVPWIHITSTSRMGADAGVEILLKNDGNAVIAIESVKLIVIGTYKSIDLEYNYMKDNLHKGEIGRIFKVKIPRDISFYEKECQIVIKYENQYSKQMKCTSPKFDVFSGNGTKEYMSIERQGKKGILFRPFTNTIY